ncbi:hypothetical protein BKA70DRAFT_1218401 [Coprinopsis sp. MPI-PUGE-AT-0042]|nr:hypothetical protein BKA70DRAFT_1218401 [Coprinopsis sp. MPI-PUGE-AT-0042]
MGLFSKLAAVLAVASLLPFPTSVAQSSDSPFLAGPFDKSCAEGAKYEGTAGGKNVTIAGVPTYLATPPRAASRNKRIILFLSDIWGPFHVNNVLLQDSFATKGKYSQNGWTPSGKEYGSTSRYTAAGYCFGGPYATEAAATDWISAAAFAHPSFLTEDQISNVKKPLLLSCAETDTVFPTESRRRAVDLLVAKNATYYHQVFSGTTHGFTTRAEPTDLDASWARNESAKECDCVV